MSQAPRRLKILALALMTAASRPAPAAAGLLSAGGVAVLDAGSGPRASFTNSERITFQQKVYNGVLSPNRVSFTFAVLSPSGAQVFQIVGNSVPGSVGNAATQLSGFPISKFYSGPGIYTLKAQATLDAEVIEQQTTFVVSSPNILLVYPPNGSQNVADVPLTFRWASSGGSTYKVTVGDNPSFYNALFTQQTSGGETFLSYPANPSDPRQRLAAGQLYYWKVEGFDGGGIKVAESASPYSFTVQTAALAKDMAVIDLAVESTPEAQQNLRFNITAKNQGGTAQANVVLRFSVGGLAAAGTPVNMPLLGPGETRDYSFLAPLPPGQAQSLAVACLEFSDDNLNNNCKTLMVNRPAAASDATIDFGATATPEQIWQAIRDILRQKGVDLSDYDLVGMEGQLTPEDLRALLESIRSGDAEMSLTGPVAKPGTPVIPGTPAPVASRADLPSSGSSANIPFAPTAAAAGTEWAGFALPHSAKAKGMLINDAGAWRKIWKSLHHGREPEVDFNMHMVIGVLAGKSERVDSVDFESVQMQLSGLVVRYRLVVHSRLIEPNGVRRAALRTTVPYYLRVIPRSTVPVTFEAVEEREDRR